jgi:hypothetical protein
MEIDKKRVESAKKGDEVGMRVSFKLTKNIEVYKISKRAI